MAIVIRLRGSPPPQENSTDKDDARPKCVRLIGGGIVISRVKGGSK